MIPSAFDYLPQAVRASSGYSEAYNNLGVRYAQRKQYAKAAAHFRTASLLAPWSAQVRANLGVTLFLSGRRQEAERAAQGAFELDPLSATCAYVLGHVMTYLRRDPEQTLRHLRIAQGRYPAARLCAARVYLRLGDRVLAEQEVQRFLSLSKSADGSTAEQILSALTVQ